MNNPANFNTHGRVRRGVWATSNRIVQVAGKYVCYVCMYACVYV